MEATQAEQANPQNLLNMKQQALKQLCMIKLQHVFSIGGISYFHCLTFNDGTCVFYIASVRLFNSWRGLDSVNVLPVLLSHWMKTCNSIQNTKGAACSIIQVLQWKLNKDTKSRKEKRFKAHVAAAVNFQEKLE